MRTIALMTDFGLDDHYVGVLHAVLERDARGVPRIDLGHSVPRGDVWTGCFLLRCAWDHLPHDAVVLAVVDPGVGSERRPVAARVDARWVVGPDNGLLGAIGPIDELVVLDWRRIGLLVPSRTFHGRDLFAPAAARLARGDHPGTLGAPADPGGVTVCPLPEPEPMAGRLRATVLHVDRFGNVITNVRAAGVADGVVACSGVPGPARRVATYSDAAAGELVLLEGSSGLLELAVNGGSAAEVTGLGRGDTVEVTLDQCSGAEEGGTGNEE